MGTRTGQPNPATKWPKEYRGRRRRIEEVVQTIIEESVSALAARPPADFSAQTERLPARDPRRRPSTAAGKTTRSENSPPLREGRAHLRAQCGRHVSRRRSRAVDVGPDGSVAKS